jgi:lysophospholipase L1-like esterase
MLRLVVPLLLAISVPAFAQDEAKPAAPVSTMELADGDCVVFLGDSITHQRLYTQYVEDFFYTRFPNMRLKFHNAGVGGAKAWDALARFDRDVAAYKPKYVTILLGMNDGRYQPFNDEIFDTYKADMTELVGKIKETGATPILMTPTMFDSRAARARKQKGPKVEFYNSVLSYYGTWLRDVAMRDGHGFVDMWGPLNNLTHARRKKDPEFTMIRDAVHPGPPGQLVMAYSIIEDMGFRKALSNIRIVGGRAKARVQATGGKVTDLNVTDDGVEFTWTANGLPWVLPAETAPAGKMLNLGHRASREALEVHILPPGKYELTIDGTAVGTYTDVQLSRHIELQANDKTPQYQQAMEVAMLNKKRNEGPISKLRRTWSQFQRIARQRRAAEAKPDDETLAKGVKTLEDKLGDHEAKIKEFEVEAIAIEDEIFKANQPVPRKYVLKRVK